VIADATNACASHIVNIARVAIPALRRRPPRRLSPAAA
jgi:hypothetical protein